jgi:protein-disulfide isomerase
MARGTLTLVIIAALAATIFGCAAGSGSPSQPSAKQQASGTSGSSEQEAESTGPSERAAAKPPGHPALGSAGAPVVLTEYSDYQ